MTRVAGVLVTHDAAGWLPEVLASVARQSRPLDRLVVVDDHSRDGTCELLDAAGIPWLPAATSRTDTVSRIAANFLQGVLAAGDVDVVVLGDHDDVWRPERVAHQVDLLESTAGAAMVASDGALVVDGVGPDGRTLRDVFRLPDGWAGMSPPERMAGTLRYVVATGGASALRPRAFPSLGVPHGWLHDRWWSLVAAARGGLLLDDALVIDYRVQPGQQVGLDLAAQPHGAVGRLVALSGQTSRSWGKQRDVRRRLRPMAATPDIASAITLRNVLRA
jgi:glycosyltransferase involved in cell wall biosynthesis